MNISLNKLILTVTTLLVFAYPGIHKQEAQEIEKEKIKTPTNIVLKYDYGKLNEQTYIPTNTPTQTPTPTFTESLFQGQNHKVSFVPNYGGNGYTYGYCTWFVKTLRPDIPNNWGNAQDWFPRAQAQGWPTGYEPRPGAIIALYEGPLGHVAYITGVDANNIYITEMNAPYWNVQTSRSIPKKSPKIQGIIY